MCRLAVGAPPPPPSTPPPHSVCIRTHMNDQLRTLQILSVVHVIVLRITETRNEPASTLLAERYSKCNSMVVSLVQ